jgi:undecaprenyl pyrophosphate synthase
VPDDVARLTKEQLEEHRDAALRRVEEAQRAYDALNSNLSTNPGGRMPTVPMRKMQSVDEELQSAEAELRTFEQELRQREY